MSDKFNKATDPQVESLADYESRTTQDLYDEGIKLLENCGYYLERNLFGPMLHHDVLVLEKPLPIKGISYPTGFKVKRYLTDPDDLSEVQRILMNRFDDEDFREFWKYVIEPDPSQRKSPYGHVKQLIAADRHRAKLDPSRPDHLGITIDCKVEKETPRAFVPSIEWFPKRMREIDLYDILTLFPDTEADLLALILGRAFVGPSNSVHVGKKEPILHTSRMAAVIVGLDAGLGKSTLFNYLIGTAGKLGYTSATFRSLGERFNLGQTITADLAYKDDLSEESLTRILKSEQAKIIVTGGEMRCEQKGIDAIDVKARSTVIINSNSFNPRIVYSLDSGSTDRFKFICTRASREFDEPFKLGASAGSVNLKPFSHIPFLAKKYDVDISCIMAYLIRLCVDRFWALVDNDDFTVNLLEKEVTSLTNNLQLTTSKGSARQVFSFFMLCRMITSGQTRSTRYNTRTFVNPEEISKKPVMMLEATQKVYGSVLKDKLGEALKEDWISKGYPLQHPYPGFRDILPHSLEAAVTKYQRLSAQGMGNSIADILKQTFDCIMLRNGFHFTSDSVWLFREFDLAHAGIDDISDFAEPFMEALSDLELKNLHD